jgi:hypothetical protein
MAHQPPHLQAENDDADNDGAIFVVMINATSLGARVDCRHAWWRCSGAYRLILFVIACEHVDGRWPERSCYCRRDKTESAGDQDQRHNAHLYAPTRL